MTVTAVEGCQREIDITLKSSDGVTFGAHTTYLEMFSNGFPPAEFRGTDGSTDGTLTVVSLPESADIVSLLLHYMHPRQQPDSSEFTFGVLERLAWATEKYMVFPATEVCKIRMK